MTNFSKLGYFIVGMLFLLILLIIASLIDENEGKPKYYELCKGGIIVDKQLNTSPKVIIKYKYETYSYNVTSYELSLLNIGDTIR